MVVPPFEPYSVNGYFFFSNYWLTSSSPLEEVLFLMPSMTPPKKDFVLPRKPVSDSSLFSKINSPVSFSEDAPSSITGLMSFSFNASEVDGLLSTGVSIFSGSITKGSSLKMMPSVPLAEFMVLVEEAELPKIDLSVSAKMVHFDCWVVVSSIEMPELSITMSSVVLFDEVSMTMSLEDVALDDAVELVELTPVDVVAHESGFCLQNFQHERLSDLVLQ